VRNNFPYTLNYIKLRANNPSGLDVCVCPTEDEAEGQTYTVAPLPGTASLPEFTPSTDTATLDLTDLREPPAVEISSNALGSTVSLLINPEDPTILRFDGLSEAPTDDILLDFYDSTDEQAFTVTLSEAIEYGQVLLATDPVDPDAEDTGEVGPSGPTSGPTGDPILPDEATILAPNNPDDETLGPEAELLLNELLERDTDNLRGRSETLIAATDAVIEDTQLSDDSDVFALPENQASSTGGNPGLGLFQSAPVLTTDTDLQVVDGRGGDDEITAGSESAFVFGGEGNDTLTGGSGLSALYGGAGEDVLEAGGNRAYLDGGLGDDSILGGAGNDILEGGEHLTATAEGDDTIDGGAGDDLIRGGYGADSLVGGAGDDVIDHQGRGEERSNVTENQFAWRIGEDADTLIGGAGNDTLSFDRYDEATGGEGEDVFWLYHDGEDLMDVAEVTDFEIGRDFLRVSLNPQIGENDEPEVVVQASPDGADGHVIVNGDLVAVLKGAPNATTSDVYATVEPDVFP
jgi:hypothetical protein